MSLTDGQQRISARSSIPNGRPAARRGPSKNWFWLAVLAVGPLCLAATFVLAGTLKSPPNYNLKPHVPQGYRAVTNPYYAFSIPKSWKKNTTMSDQNGDLLFQSRTAGSGAVGSGAAGPGSAGETTAITKTRPATDAPLPKIIGLYFEPHYRVVSRRTTTIPHATFGQLDTLQAANGRTATLYHGWVSRTQTEFWVLFTGPQATVSKMAATLIA